MAVYRTTKTYCLSLEAIQEIRTQAEKAGVSMSRYLEQCVWAQKEKEVASQ